VGVKLKEVPNEDGSHYSWAFVCPACKAVHQVDDRWSFNGDVEHPTFGGSVLVHPVEPVETTGYPGRPRCHSQVTDGRIAYYGDSTHACAGQVFELPDWDFARGLGGADG
jgi:hypothetical protein